MTSFVKVDFEAFIVIKRQCCISFMDFQCFYGLRVNQIEALGSPFILEVK